jgi:hypothetical protein
MPQATSFDSLLAQCRDLVCERLVLALAGMLDKAGDALSALASEARDPQAQKLYTVTRNKVLAQRETIAKQFRLRYLHEFQERGNRVKKIGDSFAEIDLSSLELELVAEDDLNETLKFNAMADKLREYCDEELIALDQRAGVLLGDANLQAEDNPFTPLAICDAYKRTCHQIDSNVDVRMVLLKLFDDYVLDEIRAIYKAVNSVLVENSILPNIRSVGPRRQGRGKAPPAGAQPGAEKLESAAPAGDRAPGGEQDLFSVLQNLVASNLKAMTQTGAAGGTGVLAQGTAPVPGYPPVDGMPGAGGRAEGGHAVLEGADLLQSLTRIQLGDVGAVTGGSLPRAPATGEPDTTNVLRELKGTSLGAGMNRMDSMTLDIVALLFDQLFDDPKIPIGVKGLIGRLQIPMLKVAIADKTFFSKKTHPARQMLDTLGELSSRFPADVNASNPLFGRMETILQDLSDGFEDNVEIFIVMRERLQTLITEEDQRVEQETRSAATQMEQKESLALAKTVAQAEIKVRIRDRKVPRPVIEFLVQQWIKLLLVIQVKDGEDSDAWKNALETMDLLISSVEPKDTHEERRKLVTIVPELLKRLSDGLKIAGVEDAVRLGFFSEMRKLHSEVIGRTEKPKAPAPLEATTTNEIAVADLTPVDVPPIDVTPFDLTAVDLTPVDVPRVDLTPLTPADLPPVDLRPDPLPPVDLRPDPLPPVDLPPVDLPPVDRPPVDLLPVDLLPVDLLPVDLLPVDLLPVDLRSVDLRPVDLRPVDLPPVDLPPVDLPPVDLPPVAQPARALKEAVRPDPTPPVKPPAPTPPAKPPASTPRVKQPAPSETRATNPAPLDFTAAVTVNNPFGQGEVQVDDLDFTVQLGGGTARGKRDAGHATVPENLTAGTWVAIRTKGEKDTLSLAKLSYVSPLKSRYLFVDRHGKTTLECSSTELARRFSLGELVITKEVSEPPLFDRLAAGLVGKLGGPKAPR